MKTNVILPTPHNKQCLFIDSRAKRKVVRSGRRSGKTVGVSILAVEAFLSGKRVLYAAPTQEQISRFWTEVTRALSNPITEKVFFVNKTQHIISVAENSTIIQSDNPDVPIPGDETRIRAKTAWNADTLRGDYADLLMLDEYQLMDEAAWAEVGAPMLLDNDGDAIFIYTPPSLHSRSASKARDPQHAAKLWAKAKADTSGRWEAFHFTSHDNPHISAVALSEITKDMSALAIRQEINAEDIDEAPGALWHRRKTQVGTQWVLGMEENRVFKTPELVRIVIGVDPSGSALGDACGIVGAGIDVTGHHYTIEDNSIQGSPDMWAREVCKTYHKLKADVVAAERNYGGEMVEKVIRDTDPTVNVKLVNATRGKAIRAEPISAMTERGTDHLVGNFPELEDELALWIPGDKSPNRLDAKVWADTELMGGGPLDWNMPEARIEGFVNKWS